MKLLLAGMENSLDLAVKHGVRDILVSALYMQKKKASIDAVLSNFDFVFLDSGAFTFWNKWAEIWTAEVTRLYGADKVDDTRWQERHWMDSPERKVLWDAHWQWGLDWEEEYMALLKSDARFLNRDIVHVVEFDVGNEDQMTERRKKFEKAGFNVIPVLHPKDSKDYGAMVMRDYDYVGIGGIAVDSKKFTARHFQDYFRLAKQHQTKIHGFGLTQQDPMRKMPFYSVDSTSWLSGARFGVTYIFRNGQLKVSPNKECRKKLNRECERLGIDHQLLLADNGKAVNEWNMLQWKQYADWLTSSPMKKSQEYWHDRVNGGEIIKGFDTTEEGRSVYYINGLGDRVSDEEANRLRLRPKTDEEDMEEPEDEIIDAETCEGEIDASFAIVPSENRKKTALELIEIGQFMECDNCTLGDRCPKYAEGKRCRLPFQEIKGRQDFPKLMGFLFSLQSKRVMLASVQEGADGGILDERLSKEMSRLMEMMERYDNLVNPKDEIMIKAKGPGILSTLFGLTKPE